MSTWSDFSVLAADASRDHIQKGARTTHQRTLGQIVAIIMSFPVVCVFKDQLGFLLREALY